MRSFLDGLESWQLFYATVGAASAALTGLLFVSLSLNRERLRGKKAEMTKRIARRTFGDFLYVLMISFVFIVPHQVPYSLGIALLVLGLSRGMGLLREGFRNHQKKSAKKRNILQEILLPLTASLGLLLVAVFVVFEKMNALYGLVIVIAALLVSACWNAWMLLMEE
jgi:hypothetical protein